MMQKVYCWGFEKIKDKDVNSTYNEEMTVTIMFFVFFISANASTEKFLR